MTQKMNLVLLLRMIICLLFFQLSAEAKQSPVFWGNLKPGLFAVGYKIEYSVDKSRFNKTKYDENGHYNFARQRPVVISTWYPAEANTGNKMTLRDYIKTAVIIHSNDAEKERQLAIADFKKIIQLPFIFGIKDIPDIKLEHSLTETMYARFNAKAIQTAAPVIIGAIEPHYLAVTCEWLASYGYTIVLITAPRPNEQPVLSKLFEPVIRDLEWLYGHLYQSLQLEHRKIATIGFGGSSQPAFYLCMKNHEMDGFINLEGGIFGKRSESEKAESYNPSAYHTPLLNIYITPEQEKENIQWQIDTLKKVPLIMLGFVSDSLRHHDFTILGRVAKESLLLREDKNAKIENSFVAAHLAMLAFLNHYLENQPITISKDPNLYNVKIIENN